MSSKASSSGDTALPTTKTPSHTLIRVRNNQRRHRERRRQYIALLEQRLQDSERRLNQALAELAILRDERAKPQLSQRETRSELAKDSSSQAALPTERSHSGANEISEGRHPPSNAEGFHDSVLPTASTSSIGLLSDPRLTERACPVTQPSGLQPVPVAQLPYDLNHKQQAVTIDNDPNDSSPQCRSTVDDLVDVSSPGIGTMMPQPSIPEPLLSSLSCSHYPPSNGQPTTACVQAYIVISNLNYRGLDSESITAWLNPGFRRSSLRDEGCQVESKLLFELLDFISDS